MSNVNYYLYDVMVLKCLCEIPFAITIQKEAKEFLHPVQDAGAFPCHINYTVRFEETNQLEPVAEDAYFTSDRFFHRGQNGLTVHYCPAPGRPPYACMHWIDDASTSVCQYLHGSEERMLYSRCISDLIGMETLFLRFTGLMLHASFIRWNGHGILFSAPSGTGKSTQANLWEKYEGAEILNGDRAGLRKTDGKWIAYGLPYAGSSGIYRNESAELSMIIVLGQAQENRIRRLSVAEALRKLYPETFIHHWDKCFVDMAAQQMLSLLNERPVYSLDCLPNQEAVQLAKYTLLG